MSRFALASIMILAAVALCGCKTVPSQDYKAYAAAEKGKADAQAQQIASIASAASACGDDRCVEHVAALAALAGSRSGGSGMAPPPRQISGAEKFAAVVGALSPILGNAITGAVSWHQSDNAVRQSQAQYSYLDSVLNGAFTMAGGAVPSITVGGNYGDTWGDNYTGRDRTDVAGNLARGDGNVFGDRNFNSGRQDSTGPFDRTCSGDACQGLPADGGQ